MTCFGLGNESPITTNDVFFVVVVGVVVVIRFSK